MDLYTLGVITILVVGISLALFSFYLLYVKIYVDEYLMIRQLKKFKYVDGIVYCSGEICSDNIVGYYSKTFAFIGKYGTIKKDKIVNLILSLEE